MIEELRLHIGGIHGAAEGKVGSTLALEIYERTKGSFGDILYHMEQNSVVYEFQINDGGKLFTVIVEGNNVEVKENA